MDRYNISSIEEKNKPEDKKSFFSFGAYKNTRYRFALKKVKESAETPIDFSSKEKKNKVDHKEPVLRDTVRTLRIETSGNVGIGTFGIMTPSDRGATMVGGELNDLLGSSSSYRRYDRT